METNNINLLLQLVPYTLFAIFVFAVTGFYVVESSRRRPSRHPGPQSSALSIPSGPATASFLEAPAWSSTSAGAAPAGKTQILRLHELGIGEAHIASALQMPLQEVQLVVRWNQSRRSRGPVSEIPRPTIVE